MSLRGFGEDLGDEIRFFVEDSKAFSADCLSAVFLFIFFLELLHFPEEFLIIFFAFGGGGALLL